MIAPDFTENVSAHTLEELAPYIDHYVAWSNDGKKILAYAKEDSELYKETARLGLKGGDFVAGYIPDPDLTYLGGWGFQQ